MQMFHQKSDLSKSDHALLSAGLVGAVVQFAMRWVLGGYAESLASVTTSAYTIFMAVNRQVFTPSVLGKK